MPLDRHRSCHGDDPLVLLVSHLDDDVAGITLRQSARSNLSRRAGRNLHRDVQAVELGALVIAHELRAVMDVEIVAGHGNVPFRVDAS
jgi:hypothetical protein